VNAVIKINKLAISSIDKSKCIHLYQLSGCINQVIPRIHNVLNIFDQTIPQIAISVFFLNAAIILVANSGKLVQIATIVTHINDIGNQKLEAILTALSTINFQPIINQNNHIIINNADFFVVIN